MHEAAQVLERKASLFLDGLPQPPVAHAKITRKLRHRSTRIGFDQGPGTGGEACICTAPAGEPIGKYDLCIRHRIRMAIQHRFPERGAR